MRDLAGKTAFVTGGASGIGLAVGRALAEAGMRVMLADIEAKPLEQAIDAFKGNLSEVRGVVCDVRDYAAVERAAHMTVEAFGKVHVVCNNAGVSGTSGADNISLQDWRGGDFRSIWRRSSSRTALASVFSAPVGLRPALAKAAAIGPRNTARRPLRDRSQSKLRSSFVTGWHRAMSRRWL